MKEFSSGSAMSRVWRIIGLLKEYVGECAGNCSVDRLRKRWIDTMKDCLDVRQARRMVQDRSAACRGYSLIIIIY